MTGEARPVSKRELPPCIARDTLAEVEYRETESMDSPHRVEFSSVGINQPLSRFADRPVQWLETGSGRNPDFRDREADK